jgi:hypothetical protein
MQQKKPDWLAQLEKDGYVVLSGLVPKAACVEFCEQALQWLEKFPHGFKRGDRSTWTQEHLPFGVTWVASRIPSPSLSALSVTLQRKVVLTT